MLKKDTAYLKFKDLDYIVQFKYFKSYFEFILIIQIIYIINSVIKNNIIKNHIDRAQFTIRQVFFYNLISSCVT